MCQVLGQRSIRAIIKLKKFNHYKISLLYLYIVIYFLSLIFITSCKKKKNKFDRNNRLQPVRLELTIIVWKTTSLPINVWLSILSYIWIFHNIYIVIDFFYN